MISCDKCGASFARKFNLERHQTSRCKGRMLINTVRNEATAVAENNRHQPKDFKLSSFIDNIINNTPENENTMIQPFKSTPMHHAEQYLTKNSDKEPVEEILSVHETAKKLNITPPESDDESSEDESIVEHPTKKRKLKGADDAPLIITDVHNVSKDDNLSQGNENIDNKQEGKDENDENEDVSDYDLDNIDGTVLGRGSVNEDESDYDDDDNISKDELKAQLEDV